MKFHPASELFPLIQGAEFDALVDDIRKNGQKQEIILHPDGSILDGRNRFRALEAIGVSDPRCVTWEPRAGGGAEEAVVFVTSLNLKRRHLSESQIGAIAVKAKDFIDREAGAAAERRAATGRDAPRDELGRLCPVVTPTSQPVRYEENKTRAKLAQAFGVGTTTIQQAMALKKAGREADLAAVERGEKNFAQIRREDAAARKAERRAENERLIVAGGPVVALGDLVARGARFSCITLDPPWEYEETEDGSGDLGSPDYATMKLVDIARLPVGELADVDCHLYCWTTFRFLEATFGLVRGWGFKPRALLTWHKPGLGLGSFFRWNAEYVLVGTRGDQGVLVRDQGVVFSGAPGARRHSAKPLEFYGLVERCSPGPYMEFFARGGRPGWTSYGEGGVKESV